MFFLYTYKVLLIKKTKANPEINLDDLDISDLLFIFIYDNKRKRYRGTKS